MLPICRYKGRLATCPAGTGIILMLVGKKLGPFVVDKELGAGAMGTVYRGRHKQTGQKVAIKIIAPGLAANKAAMNRFTREISILKQLDHPHIVKLLLSGKLSGTPFYVMEYVEGESLDHVMERRGRIPWEEIIPLGQQLCSALQYAHDKGIIHRDLKPSNLMVLGDDRVKLTDFGIAKDIDVTALTAANSTVGTAAYMSPEQCRGDKDLTSRSDLYSMGVMFYELVTGRKPFSAETAMEMFMQHLNGKFAKPSYFALDTPIWLDDLICKLMEKDPDKRPFSADAVSRELGRIREKVASQTSAGLEAARKRKIDRSTMELPLDEADKEAARTLLGKKKKKKTVPVYRRGWFTVSAVAAVLVALGIGFYLAFLKVPSPESYVETATSQLKSSDFATRKEGRATIDEFLRHYKDHDKAKMMQSLADQFDLEECDKQMHNRRNARFKAEPGAESLAREALDYEDLGKLAEALQPWTQLVKFKEKTNAEDRAWGLVGEKYLKELRSVSKLYEDLTVKVKKEITTGNKSLGETKAEGLALDAVRKEATNQAQALNAWNDLKTQTKDDADNRRWYLLAAQKHRELSEMQK